RQRARPRGGTDRAARGAAGQHADADGPDAGQQPGAHGAGDAAARAATLRPGGPPAPPPRGGDAGPQARRERRGPRPPRGAAEPTNVVPGGNGWSTWLYDDGRMISFDGRGRAQSLAGFPGP